MTPEEKEKLLETAEYINVGCGNVRFKNCINMDIVDNPFISTDVIGSVLKIPFPDERFKGVLLVHVLEHLVMSQHDKALKEIHRVLKPEGTVLVEVPDFKLALQFYLDNFQGRKDYWYQCIYGRDKYESDTHKSGITQEYLTDMLFNCGFVNLKWIDIPSNQAILGVIAKKSNEKMGSRL